MTWAIKKLINHKNTAQLAINVLCDLSKKHCAMCEWEQDCSDNPLLLDPVLTRQCITERCSWFINKQSMCAKCKLQLGEHLLNHQAQNNTNSIELSEHANCAINCQCNHYQSSNPKATENLSDVQKFDNFTSKDLI
jgi:hypothetical protein